MPFYFLDSTFLLIIPAVLLALWAQNRVKSTYRRYSKVPAQYGWTGAELAHRLLRDKGLNHVTIEEIPGEMTDHYDPRTRTLRLSSGVARSRSVAALGIAAHEVGHAFQHQDLYQPFQIRQHIVPVAGIGTKLAFPLVFIGLLMSFPVLMDIGIVFFSGAVLFQLVTLPVEYNASHRALALLKQRGYLATAEVENTNKVLSAAALTYVAAAAVAVLQLIRLLVLRNNGD